MLLQKRKTKLNLTLSLAIFLHLIRSLIKNKCVTE